MRPFSSARSGLLVGVIVGLTSIGSAALAHKGITGRSGKQGNFCTSCHNGGPVPTVKLEGPTSLDAGESALYTFTITTTNVTTAMNAAVSEGSLSGGDGGTTRTLPFTSQGVTTDEIVQSDLLKPSDAGADAPGEAIYTFLLTAPPYGEKIALFAAGNTVNLDNTPQGDNAAKDALAIQVNGPPKPAPPPDAATPPATVDAGSSPSTPSAAPDDDSGCAVGSLGSDAGPMAPAGALLVALVALAALRRRGRGD